MPRQTTLLTYLNTVAGLFPQSTITEWPESVAPSTPPSVSPKSVPITETVTNEQVS